MSTAPPLETCIGIGSFGRVFKEPHAEHGFIARKYCADAYVDEARALRLLQLQPHDNVVRVLGVLTPSDARLEAVFSMELCDSDLYSLVESNGCLDEAALRPIAAQMLAGLRHCMAQDVYHGDVKPENVLLKRGVVKLADFGLCTFTKTVPRKDTMTPQYAAPELLCYPPLDAVDVEKADVWSFGITLAICVTGALPMEAYNDLRVCARFRAFVDMCAGKGLDAPSAGALTAAHAKAIRLLVLNDAASKFSLAFHNFIGACVHPLAAQRMRFEELAAHPWLLA